MITLNELKSSKFNNFVHQFFEQLQRIYYASIVLELSLNYNKKPFCHNYTGHWMLNSDSEICLKIQQMFKDMFYLFTQLRQFSKHTYGN